MFRIQPASYFKDRYQVDEVFFSNKMAEELKYKKPNLLVSVYFKLTTIKNLK